VNTGDCKRTLSAHGDPVTSIDSLDNLLVSGSYDGIVRLWNVETGENLSAIPDKDNYPISFTKLKSGKGVKYIFLSTLGSVIRLLQWNGNKLEFKKAFTGLSNVKYCIFSSVFTLSKLYLVSGSEDNSIYFWDVNSGSGNFTNIKGHQDVVLGVTVHNLGKEKCIMGTCCMDGSIKIWEVKEEDIDGDAM